MRCMVSVLFLFLAGGFSVAGQEVSSKGSAAVSATPQKDVLAIDESLNDSQYINRTAKFSLVLPPDWIINKEVRHSPSTLAWLSTPDKRNWVGVTKEQDAGSLENFKEVFEVRAQPSLPTTRSSQNPPSPSTAKPRFAFLPGSGPEQH
jgi:hypothetical protein